MNKILGIKKCIKKGEKNKKLSKKQGVVLAETVLMIAIGLVIGITIFYPTFRNIINETLASVSNWYTTALLNLGIN